MKMRMTARGVELTTELKDYVTRRAHFGLGRFAGKIKSVSVQLADINGPRGGIDKCCHITVDAGLSQKVIVRERQETVHAAVAIAMERVERVVERQLSLTGPAARRSAAPRADFQFGD
jgi:putative sigma-54 modulation protein